MNGNLDDTGDTKIIGVLPLTSRYKMGVPNPKYTLKLTSNIKAL